MKRPPFDPKRARGDSFAGGLFDPRPVAPASGHAVSATGHTTGDPAESTTGNAAGETAGNTTGGTATPKEISVSQFSELITRALEDGLRGSFRIQGEIANLSRRSHWYFTIKDAKAVLPCVMWQSDAARVGFEPREGDAVVVTGRVGHYAPQGKTQLYATKLEKQGIGSLEERFQRLCAELRTLGYFDPSRKKPLPEFPRRVAVVTSRTGAALQDVIQTARERCAAVELVTIDVRVQGDGAADEVARALRAIDRIHARERIDAVIVTRGGGSREDLWAFNERVVADAALALSIPLVAAIGHEVDTTVVELVADCRASTPTQAVMLLLPDLAELADRRARAARDLRNAMRWRVSSLREDVARVAASTALASPALRIARSREALLRLEARGRAALGGALARERRTLDRLGAALVAHAPAARAAAARAALAALDPRLRRAIDLRISSSRRDLVNLERRLRSAGPEETLQRGYAIITTTDGALVRSAGAAAPGSSLQVQLADGTIPVRVEERF